jgi:putative component of membrane protein insertase Oxa1/YidC/SpoIIIJ protein YidD
MYRRLAAGLDGCAARIALVGIRLYQHHISPRKGFRCSHAALTGGPSCSHAVAGLLQGGGLIAALPAIRGQFLDCRQAYATIQGANLHANHDILNLLTSGFNPLRAGERDPHKGGACGPCG